MRIFPFILFLLLTTCAWSQRYKQDVEKGVAMGLSGGYSSKKCMIGNLSAGLMLTGQNHVSANLQVLGKIDAADLPVMGEFRVGHGFGPVEFYGGIGYHYATSDGEKFIREKVNGWRPAYGIQFKFPHTPYTISAGMSGSIFSMQLGVFAVR